MNTNQCPPWCETKDGHGTSDGCCTSTGHELTVTAGAPLLDSSGVYLPTIRVYACKEHPGEPGHGPATVELCTETETGADIVQSLTPEEARALAHGLMAAAEQARQS